MPDYKKKRKHYKRINKDKYSDTAADISMSRSEPKKEKRSWDISHIPVVAKSVYRTF